MAFIPVGSAKLYVATAWTEMVPKVSVPRPNAAARRMMTAALNRGRLRAKGLRTRGR